MCLGGFQDAMEEGFSAEEPAGIVGIEAEVYGRE
jgi:hypothetical protein